MLAAVHGAAFGSLYGSSSSKSPPCPRMLFTCVETSVCPLLNWDTSRHWFVIGAVITILLLGFEPFLQSVIYYKGAMEPVADSLPPLLRRSAHLDAGKFYTTGSSGIYSYLLPNGVSVRYSPFNSQPDLGMLAALYNGFYNGTSSADLTTSFLCPSGNCIWDPFASIAACSTFHDLTGQLEREEKFGNNLGTIRDSKMMFSDTFIKYYLPYVSLSNGISTREFDAYMSAVPRTLPKDTVTFKDLKTMITSVGMIKADRSYAEGASWNETAVTATECALYLCTNAYESAVKNGVLEERVVASWADRNMDSYAPLDNRITTKEGMAAYEKWYDHPLYVRDKNIERGDLELRIPLEEAEKYNLPLAGISTTTTLGLPSRRIRSAACLSTWRMVSSSGILSALSGVSVSTATATSHLMPGARATTEGMGKDQRRRKRSLSRWCGLMRGSERRRVSCSRRWCRRCSRAQT